MLRRILLMASASLWGPWPILASAKRRIAPNHTKHLPMDVVLDQSGVLGNGAFVIGAFTTPDPQAFVRASARARRDSKYRTTLTHGSRDKWKIGYALKIIDIWLGTPGARIEVLIVSSGRNQIKETPDDRLNRYIDLVSRLIDNTPRVGGPMRRLVTQMHFPDAQQSDFESALRNRSRRFERAIHIQERDSDILQLLDFIVGAVYASQPDVRPKSQNKSKLQAVALLKEKLGGASLSTAMRKDKFTITYV